MLVDSQFLTGSIFPDTGTGARDRAGVDPVDIEQIHSKHGGVQKRGTPSYHPKSDYFSIESHGFWGTHILGNIHLVLDESLHIKGQHGRLSCDRFDTPWHSVSSLWP